MHRYLSVLFLFITTGINAQIVQVADIRAGAGSSDPESCIWINGQLFFRADDGTHGKEWFTTDGTATGTQLLKDIYPGLPGSSLAGVYTNYIEYNDLLLFEAVDTALNHELWRSDGTAAGTFKVKEIYPGTTNGGLMASLQNADGLVYFAGEDADHGIELWTTDATEAGTYMVCDIDATAPTINSSPEKFYAYNGLVYFEAVKDNLGDEIWVTDGTCGGTSMLKNLNNGDGDGCHPDYFTDYLDIIYFTAYTDLDGPIDTELWKSDGTAAGTQLVKDIAPGIAEGLPRYLTVVNGQLCFSAKSAFNDYELWTSDGTEAGTVLLKDIFTGTTGSNPQNFMLVGTTLFFTADDGVNGKELWKTDGTTGGTVLVKNMRAGATSSNPANLTAVNEVLYFTANNGVNGNELWRSDGTEAGTVMVEDLNPAGSSSPSNLFFTGETLYFAATAGATGKELYKLDNCPADFASVTPSGPVEFCKGESVILNAPVEAGYAYQWKKNGADIAGATASSYTATKSGNYEVEITSGTCIDISDMVVVTVYNKPNPVITNQDATNDLCFDTSIKLKTNGGAGDVYQWYKSASPLAGATSMIFFATTTGNYKVNVTNIFGCSKMSAPYTIINSCRYADVINGTVTIYPNPNNGTFNLLCPGFTNEEIRISIYNITGECIFTTIEMSDEPYAYHLVLPDGIPPGIYMAEICAGEKLITKQFVIE